MFKPGTKVYRSAAQKSYFLTSQNMQDIENNSRELRAAGIIAPDDSSAVHAVTILDQVLGYQRKAYSLRAACQVIGMDKLTAKLPVATKNTASEKVPPMVEPEIRSDDYTTVDFDLWKDAGYIGVSDESQMKSAINVLDLNIQNCSRDLNRLENKQIDEAIDDGTITSNGADWGSTNNPYDDIGTAEDSIEGTYDHEPDMILGHPSVWRDFFSNDYVKGSLEGTRNPQGKIFTIPGLPGWTGISDYALLSTSAFVLASKAPALVLGEGPTMAAAIRDDKAGYDAYIIRQWREPKLVQDGALYELTTVNA